jgi:hypothetical protein
LTFLSKAVASLSSEANTTVMADDFASLIYAIALDNQPRPGSIDADQSGISAAICSLVNGFSARAWRQAIYFHGQGRSQHLISARSQEIH